MASAKSTRRRRATERLLQQSARQPDAPRDYFSWRLWAAFVAAGMFLIAFRTPHDWLHPIFYVEDGVIFFRDQMVEGWRVIFRTYNGYFHLIPRLAALVSSVAPVRDQPLIYYLINVVIQSLAASFFLLPRNRVIVRSDALRLCICVLTLLDFQASEMLNNVMVVQWYLFPVALLILCHLGSREKPLGGDIIFLYCLLMAVICLSTPLLVIIAPIALAVLVWRARGLEKLVPATMIASVAIQGIAFWKTGLTEQPTGPHEPAGLMLIHALVGTIGGWVYRDVFTIILSERAAQLLAHEGGEALAGALFLVVMAGCYYVWKTFPRSKSVILLSALAVSIGMVGTSLVVRHMLIYIPDLTHYAFFGGGARYFYVSGWLVLVMGAMLAERVLARWTQFGRAMVVVAIFGLGALGNYSVDEMPPTDWPASAPVIEEWRMKRDRHEPRPHVNVPIYPAPWTVDLPASL